MLCSYFFCQFKGSHESHKAQLFEQRCWVFTSLLLWPLLLFQLHTRPSPVLHCPSRKKQLLSTNHISSELRRGSLLTSCLLAYTMSSVSVHLSTKCSLNSGNRVVGFRVWRGSGMSISTAWHWGMGPGVNHNWPFASKALITWWSMRTMGGCLNVSFSACISKQVAGTVVRPADHPLATISSCLEK